jgi:GTP-binding protein
VKTVGTWERTLKKTWDEMPPAFLTSAEKKTGRDELLAYIESILKSRHTDRTEN